MAKASYSSSKPSCVACDGKAVGLFKCEGCSQIFCRKHVDEHRDILSQQLDAIVVERDSLYQTFNQQNGQLNSSLALINNWEQAAIEKIQNAAAEARQQVEKMIAGQKDNASEKLRQLTDQLRKAREEDDFFEIDLRKWAARLEKLKFDRTTASPSITIQEDPSMTLVGKICITRIIHSLMLNEQLVSSSGEVQISDNDRVAIHNGPYSTAAYLHGTREYSMGKHKIRFSMNKRSTKFVSAFNIVSKSMLTTHSKFNTKYVAYGWQTDDCTNGSSTGMPIRDLRGETTFEIEFLLDCDNQKISYFNVRTKNIREMNIDIIKCPFPWLLQFYLYDIGDCVRLLSSQETL